MRAVVQRVSRAAVRVEGRVVGQIAAGALILLGVGRADTPESARALAQKIANLRIFVGETADPASSERTEKANRSLLEIGAATLVVSQFTLYGDCRKGRRPSFIDAAAPPIAIPLYEAFINGIKALGVPTAAGRFGADMQVELVNDGPVTLIVDRACV